MPGKLNIVTRLQHWMDSVPGQTFLNYAYSWGAAIVILGALFKLTHLKGGNIMLFVGMGTEAVVFFLAAFDRPFDKTEIGKELPHDFESDEEIERAEGLTTETAPDVAAQPGIAAPAAPAQPLAAAQATAFAPQLAPAAPGYAPQTSVAAAATGALPETAAAPGTPLPQQPVATAQAASETAQVAEATAQAIDAAAQPAVDTPQTAAPFVAAHYQTAEGQRALEEGAQRLAEIVRLANDELLRRTQAVLSPEMEEATEEYIEKLRTLNETLAKVDEQSARLTRDSQEMENLNRTLIGINKVYDLHFASISRQVTTIEEINAQTRDLAAKIEEVNQIYARMVQTLNIMGNPYAAMSAAGAQPAAAAPAPATDAPTQPNSAS
ncbi:MAG: gliding motility protein GldL [Prevotellaceae bacterium]|nr:gliding motility protein GldL [Prevotellaceae bacterium]